MARVVLDSSVLVSAFLTPEGPVAGLVLAGVDGAFRVCLSGAILAEVAATLLGKRRLRKLYPYDDARVRAFLDELAASAELVGDLPDLCGAVPGDPWDDPIVATAVAARADYLVTGDRHLLALGAYAGIRVLTPRELSDLLRSPGPPRPAAGPD
jgi:uncharacterized protein